jgi:hypothetical protein
MMNGDMVNGVWVASWQMPGAGLERGASCD